MIFMNMLTFIYNENDSSFQCHGDWSILNLDKLNQLNNAADWPNNQTVIINGKQLTRFDSAGALILTDYIHELEKRQNQITLEHFNQKQQDLLAIIKEKKDDLHYEPPIAKQHHPIYLFGKQVTHKFEQISGFITLIGDLSDKLIQGFKQLRQLQGPSIVSNLYSAGINALPIVGLLSFLIGIVLAYQMGLQLETYGANNFIAYLSGMAVFREFGPLIAAIIVAGRTSSAFTAQIGSMKINEEIDALLTMGLSPTQLLVIPKLLGLLIAFPLIIFWADFFGILGAMFMSKAKLSIGYYDFLSRLQDAVGLKPLLLGLYKAPAFAILIALVGCFQGFRVESNADSVGKQTTKSVVQALFLIIITDAIYSIIYSWKGI